MTSRSFYLLSFLIPCALLGYGYYLQFHDGLDPCPMCIFQRLCYMAIAAVALIATLHGPNRRGTIFYSGLCGLAALIGSAIAGRQVWLQHLPEDRVPECGPGLDFMLEVYPLFDTIKLALRGSGECASVDWTFLGASIAEWSLLWFVIFTTVHIASLTGIFPRHSR